MKIRTLSLFLILAMLLTAACAFAGCGKDEPEEEKKPQTEDTDKTDEKYGTLGEKDWEGRECKILGVFTEYEPSFEIAATLEDTDTVSQAVVRRNAAIESLFNAKVAQVGTQTDSDNFGLDMMTGERDYDMAFLYRDEMASAILNSYFINIYDADNIDWDQKYYNRSTLKSMEIGGELFHMASNFSLTDKNRIASLFYNRDLAADHGIPDVINAVKNGTWTYEKFIDYVRDVSLDVDSNGKMEYQTDNFGVTIGSRDESICFWTGLGAKFVTFDDNGNYELTYGNQYAISCAEKVREVFADPNLYFASQTTDNYEGAGIAFEGGRALFYGAVLSSLPSIAGSVSFRYSVLPFPKFDESQERYYSNNNNRYCATFGIPICAPDPDFTGFMIEALSWKSTDTTLTAYYDVACKRQNSYDQECADMIDVLFGALSFDFGFLYSDVIKVDSNTPKSIVSGSLRYNDRELSTYYAENSSAQKQIIDRILKKVLD